MFCNVCDWQHAVRQCLQVPIMLRSDYCSLHDQDDMQLQDLGECPYDQVLTKCTTVVSSHLSLGSSTSPTQTLLRACQMHQLSVNLSDCQSNKAYAVVICCKAHSGVAYRAATLSSTAVRRFSLLRRRWPTTTCMSSRNHSHPSMVLWQSAGQFSLLATIFTSELPAKADRNYCPQ